MDFLLGFLGAILGIIVIITVLVLIVYSYMKKIIGKSKTKELINLAKNAKMIQNEEYTRVKNVNGMTKLLEPEIIRDFPDFNRELLFSKVESNLIKIFNAIQYKTISNIKDDDELKLLYFKVEDNIKFHEHAIKEYIKSQGMATITTSSTVEYYYKNTAENNEMSNLKKQTRYTCKFVYIYDENKIGNNRNSFSISCPNCGAPLIGIGNYVCEYCSSQITPINLKTWKMSSYKEDYK